MALELLQVQGHGKHNAEFVEIAVLENCDLAYFMLADTTFTSENTISNKVRNTHWFESKKVAKGDHIFLRTGKGTDTSQANRAGTMTHVIHRGLDRPVWNNTGDGAILFSLRTWKAQRT